MLIEKNGNLIIIPALIDSHVHFRTPGAEHKENWISGAQAAFAGGVTTVIDMPNNNPAIVDLETLQNKKSLINAQLKEVGLNLYYYLYLGATANNWTEFEKCKDQIIGVKMFMSASTGTLLVDKLEDQEKVFAECARLNLLLAVHAVGCVQQAIELAKKFGTKLYICHVSTKEEIEAVRRAKKQGLKIYAEVAPHHLFLDKSLVEKLGAKAKMIPGLAEKEDCEALWQGIYDGTVDAIGTDHAPHTLEEKSVEFDKAPSGVPGIETMLPLLLNAYNEGRITLEKIVELTHTSPMKIFNLPETGDKVEVDLDLVKEVKNEELKTKCGWSPFVGWKLRGWPVSIVHSH